MCLELTEEQIKAVKSLERAFRKCTCMMSRDHAARRRSWVWHGGEAMGLNRSSAFEDNTSISRA
jgi:hypothetical protein